MHDGEALARSRVRPSPPHDAKSASRGPRGRPSNDSGGECRSRRGAPGGAARPEYVGQHFSAAGWRFAAAPEHPTRTSAPPRRLTSDACAACAGRPREPGQPFAVASKPRVQCSAPSAACGLPRVATVSATLPKRSENRSQFGRLIDHDVVPTLHLNRPPGAICPASFKRLVEGRRGEFTRTYVDLVGDRQVGPADPKRLSEAFHRVRRHFAVDPRSILRVDAKGCSGNRWREAFRIRCAVWAPKHGEGLAVLGDLRVRDRQSTQSALAFARRRQ